MMDEDEYHKSSKDDGGEWNGGIPPIERRRPHHFITYFVEGNNLNFGRDHSRTFLRGMSLLPLYSYDLGTK